MIGGGSSRYEILPGLLLGFHGTDADTAERVLAGRQHLKKSKNSYDWLGHGVYFWEYSPQRALDLAEQAVTHPAISKGKVLKPPVIGAVSDPGTCLNLLEASALAQLKEAYELLLLSGTAPQNIGGIDKLQRHLDCAVIELLHSLRSRPDEGTGMVLPAYETVRGAFWEGDEIYPHAGFREKNHIQIVVRDTACINGYFRPIIRERAVSPRRTRMNANKTNDFSTWHMLTPGVSDDARLSLSLNSRFSRYSRTNFRI